jgi:hypothetical protein
VNDRLAYIVIGYRCRNERLMTKKLIVLKTVVRAKEDTRKTDKTAKHFLRTRHERS